MPVRTRDVELFEAMAARMTVCSFSTEPVPKVAIEKAVRAALEAPSYDHRFRWAFIQVSGVEHQSALADACGLESIKDRKELDAMFSHLEDEARRMYFAALPRQRRMTEENRDTHDSRWKRCRLRSYGKRPWSGFYLVMEENDQRAIKVPVDDTSW